MNTFFDILPQGSIRLSKTFVGRVRDELSGLSRFPQSPGFPGNAGNDACGPWMDPEFDPVRFAEVTAKPTGIYLGYSWLEKRLGADGTSWYTPDNALQGDNGSFNSTIGPIDLATINIVSGIATFETTTDHGFAADQLVSVSVDDDAAHSGDFRILSVPSDTSFTVAMPLANYGASISGTASVGARPAKMAAYAIDGSEDIAVGTKAMLIRGYLNAATDDQQWIIIAVSTGVANKRVRPTDPGIIQSGKTYYPSVLDLYDIPTKDFVDGREVWLESRQAAALSEDGTGIYHSILEDPSFKVDTGSTATITNVARLSDVVTIETEDEHGFSIGDEVIISDLAGDGSTLNGTATITSVSALSFTFTLAGADIASAADTGTVTGPKTLELWVTRDRPYLTDVECIAGVLVKTSDGPITVSTSTSLRYVGDYDDASTYKRGDVVRAASTYVAIVATVPAGNPPPNPTYWEPLTLDFVSAYQQAEVHTNVTPDDVGEASTNTTAFNESLSRGVKQISFPAGKTTLSAAMYLTAEHSSTKFKGAGMGVPFEFLGTEGATWPTTGGGFPRSASLGDQDAPTPTPLGYLSTFGATDATHIYVGEFIDQFFADDYIFLGHFNSTQVRDTQQQLVKISSVTPTGGGAGTMVLADSLNTTYFPLDLTKTISNVARTSNIVTITTSTAHTFLTNQFVTISGLAGAGAPLNGGPYLITGTPLTTTFTFTLAGTNIGSAADSGSAFRQGGGNHKYARNSRKVASISGDIVTLTDAADTSLFTVGKFVVLCDGFSIVDAWLEWFEVIETADSPGTALTSGQIILSPEPRRTFVSGRTALIPGPWIEDVTFERFFSDYFTGRGCVNLKLVESFFSAYSYNLASSYKVRFIRCAGFFQLNSNQDVIFDDCDILVMSFEESNSFITIQNSRLYRALITSFDTNDVALINCDIYWDQRGGGFGGSFVQLNSGLNTDRVRLINNRFWSNSFTCTILGNNAQVTGNYLHTSQSLTLDGLNHIVEGNYGPGTIVLAIGSTGKLRGNTCAIAGDLTGWDIEHSSTTTLVTNQIINGDRWSVFDRDSGSFINYLALFGLVPMDGYWPLDEDAGDANDASGNGHPLAQYGSCPASIGKFGNARSFPTAADGLMAAYTDIFGTHELYPEAFGIVAGETITIRVLINVIDEDVSGSIANLWQNSNQWLIAYDGSDQTILFAVRAGGTSWVFNSSVTVPETGDWVRVKLVIDDVAKTATLKIDSNTPQVESYSGTIGTAGNIFGLGNDGYFVSPFAGYIDDLRIDKRAWATDEETADLNGGDFAPPPLFVGDFQPLSPTLTNLAAISSSGFVACTGVDIGTGGKTFATRSLVAPSAGITISNTNGIGGDPTFALANDLGALEALSGTNTIYYRSGTSTWTAVTIGSGLSFSGGTLSASGGGTETANTVYAGPTTGSPATPTFRALVKADQVSVTVYTDIANTWTVGGQIFKDGATAGTCWIAKDPSNNPFAYTGDFGSVPAYAGAYVLGARKIHIQAGDSASLPAVGGRLFATYTNTSQTHTDGTFDDLHSFTIAGNTFAVDGSSIIFETAIAILTAPSTPVSIRLHYAGTNVLLLNGVTFAAAGEVVIRATILRVSSSSVRYMISTLLTGGTVTLPAARGTITGLTLSSNTTLKIMAAEGPSGSPASTDIINTLSTVEYMPPPP